jgi:hypothetical protein
MLNNVSPALTIEAGNCFGKPEAWPRAQRLRTRGAALALGIHVKCGSTTPNANFFSQIRTDLDAFTEGEMDCLENHGYSLTDAAMRSFGKQFCTNVGVGFNGRAGRDATMRRWLPQFRTARKEESLATCGE